MSLSGNVHGFSVSGDYRHCSICKLHEIFSYRSYMISNSFMLVLCVVSKDCFFWCIGNCILFQGKLFPVLICMERTVSQFYSFVFMYVNLLVSCVSIIID
jgi:hypothetical protein